jgi:LacI family transcriptional regulator
MKNLTLEDIARMANVSPATVSRVINNQVGERSKVRERVLKVISETGFRPHAAARSLAGRRSDVIGLLVPAPASWVLSHLYLLQLAEHISRACQSFNYILSLFLTGSDGDEQHLLPKITRKGFVDGLIVRAEGRGSDPLLEKLLEIEVPFVASGRPTGPQHISYVAADNATAAHHALTHLIRLGRKRIAIIPGVMESFSNQERLRVYRKVLYEHGLPLEEGLIAHQDDGYLATRTLLAQRPDAIFLATRLILGVLQALHEADRQVPDDIALIGFDDLPLAQQTNPLLTTMRQPMAAMGKRLVEILLDRIEKNDDPPQQVIFEEELVVRESCGALKP